MRDYGVRLYAQGFDFRLDRRVRDIGNLPIRFPSRERKRKLDRGPIRGFSVASLRRLAFVLANADAHLRCMLTLTYHGTEEPGESAAGRNRRLIRRSKKDLNRFLSCVRRELGPYVWVMEFQERGAVHYHVLCQNSLSKDRVAAAWLRSIDSLDDLAAIRHGVKVDHVRSDASVRSYLSSYIAKGIQKGLPAGVEAAGRWWGRSRGLELKVLEEMVTCERHGQETHAMSSYVLRALRRYLSKRFRRKFRGGMFTDWGGRISGVLREMIPELRAGYMRMADAHLSGLRLEEWGWEPVEEVKTDAKSHPRLRRRVAAHQHTGGGQGAGETGPVERVAEQGALGLYGDASA